MRKWNLSPGDPLSLTLAVDFRLCTPDYLNDQIWELEIGAGDPPAFSLCTTYGLRALTMRIFPRFSLGGITITNPASFPLSPRLSLFYPNFLSFYFSPIKGISVEAEYWVPDSHTTAGHFTITNLGSEPVRLQFELCAQLIPLDGQNLASLSMRSVNILAGRSANLAPVLFLTGGPQPGPGPFPSLALDLALAGGGSRTLTWTQAALAELEDSFDLARHTATRRWEAERTKIEMVNANHFIDVYTGDPDWDVAFALSQKTAFGLFIGSSPHLPYPSFVSSRLPNQGYSPRGDGKDYPPQWSGQTPFEAWYLASTLIGAPELAAGLVRNFIAACTEEGHLDCKPGLAGQRSHWLATPLLASLAWKTFQKTHDLDFLREVQPGLETFTNCWFHESCDRDGDGFPEWDHPLQTGLEDIPAFNFWRSFRTGDPGFEKDTRLIEAGFGQGFDFPFSESPALLAFLCREAQANAQIAGILDQPENRCRWEMETGRMRTLVEECWQAVAMLYHKRDRDTHFSPKGKILRVPRVAGKHALSQSFRQPVRLLIRLELQGEGTRKPRVSLQGKNDSAELTEHLGRGDFQWGAGVAVAITRKVYTRLDEIETIGLAKRDRVSVFIMDFSAEDVTLFLPLWAGFPDLARTRDIANHSLFDPNRFGGRYGIPVCSQSNEISAVYRAVHIPWNALIGEGLLKYELQAEAAVLTARLMAAVIQNLKLQHAFSHTYDSESGLGMGERNTVQGLAPLGLFLDTVGISIESTRRVRLSGKNPFPWPVTVKYRGLTVTRQANQTMVVFADGDMVTLNDPSDAVVSTE
jgi:hypothetical protein